MTSGIPCEECAEYPAVIQTPWSPPAKLDGSGGLPHRPYRYLCAVCLVDTEV